MSDYHDERVRADALFDMVVERDARIKELEVVAEAAVIVCQLVDEKSSMVYGLLERPLRAAGYLGGGENGP